MSFTRPAHASNSPLAERRLSIDSLWKQLPKIVTGFGATGSSLVSCVLYTHERGPVFDLQHQHKSQAWCKACNPTTICGKEGCRGMGQGRGEVGQADAWGLLFHQRVLDTLRSPVAEDKVVAGEMAQQLRAHTSRSQDGL